MLRSDWPEAVDARLTTQPKEGAVSTSSESRDEGAGQKESPPVSKKVWGKRVAKDGLARKKRRTADVAPRKPVGISFSGGRTARMQSTAISEWSDDDKAPVAPPLSTKASSRSTRAEVQSKGGKGVPEQRAEKTSTAGAARPLA